MRFVAFSPLRYLIYFISFSAILILNAPAGSTTPFTHSEIFVGVQYQSEDFSSLMESGDAAWEKRGTKEDLDNKKALDYYMAALDIDPYSYEAHWKAARSLWWISDQMLPSSTKGGEHEKIGREAMELSKRATLIDPESIEGHLYLALSAIHYSHGIGVIDAMKEGTFDVILSNLMWCYERDKSYGNGIIPRSLSSFYRTAPWSTRDNDKSLKFALEAEEIDPEGIRTRVYLAASYEASGMPNEAMGVLTEASKLDGNSEGEPDYIRWEKFADRCLEEKRMIDPEKLL